MIFHAQESDANDKISSISDSSFKVSNLIKFYEKSEIVEWIDNSKDNIFLVAKTDKIVGFLFCKVMSNHSAMLDNFYVKERRKGYGKMLFEKLKEELEIREIEYLSSLAEDHLIEVLGKFGFLPRKQYV